MGGRYRSAGPQFFVPRGIALAYGGVGVGDDDAVTTIDHTYGGKLVITGGALNHTFEFDDARELCPPGELWFLEVTNASSEFVGVHANGEAAFLVRIPPRGKAEFVCTDNSTAAGTWAHRLERDHSGIGVYGFEDFIGGVGVSTQNNGTIFAGFTSGAGSTAAVSTWVDAGTYGMTQLTPGTTANGFAGYYSNRLTRGWTQGAAQAVEAFFGPGASLSDGVDNFILAAGFMSIVTNAFPDVNAVALYTDFNTHADHNWRAITKNAGVGTTTTDTGVASVASTLQYQRIEIASSRTRADFWIGRVHVAAHAANLPTDAADGDVGAMVRIEKTLGTTACRAYLDFVAADWQPVTPRF